MPTDWFDNDELFLKECKAGHQWERYVASFFALQGLPVDHPTHAQGLPLRRHPGRHRLRVGGEVADPQGHRLRLSKGSGAPSRT